MLRTTTLLISLTLGTASVASFEVYLKDSNQIPLFAQETNVWCGAASAQMMLQGFPEDVNHVYEQRFVWDTIQPLKVETGWYTDPDGLKRVMEKLGGNDFWETRCSKGSSGPLLKSIVKNMKYQKYPVTVLVYGSAHWIVVIGATTDQDPAVGTTIVLEKIEAFDPWEAQHVLVSGTAWMKKYWANPARSRGKWSGCYVAIQKSLIRNEAEPDFHVTVRPSKAEQKFLSSDEIAIKAAGHLRKLAAEHPQFSGLLSEDLLEPLLISHAAGNYFLIPLGASETGLSSGAITLDADSGEWEGLTKFRSKRNYLTKQKAITASGLKAIRSGEWIFSPSIESPSPFLPAYKLQSSQRTSSIYIDQNGKLSASLHPMQP